MISAQTCPLVAGGATGMAANAAVPSAAKAVPTIGATMFTGKAFHVGFVAGGLAGAVLAMVGFVLYQYAKTRRAVEA